MTSTAIDFHTNPRKMPASNPPFLIHRKARPKVRMMARMQICMIFLFCSPVMVSEPAQSFRKPRMMLGCNEMAPFWELPPRINHDCWRFFFFSCIPTLHPGFLTVRMRDRAIRMHILKKSCILDSCTSLNIYQKNHEKSKNPKLIPKLDMTLLKKIRKSKINSQAWHEFIEKTCRKLENPRFRRKIQILEMTQKSCSSYPKIPKSDFSKFIVLLHKILHFYPLWGVGYQ